MLVLEDESGRVNLKTDKVHQFATGTVVAVEGIVKTGGLLHVQAFYSPSPMTFPSFQGDLRSSTNGNIPHVLLISGLNCGDPNVSSMQRDMLLAYLQGHLTQAASKVCRVIVAGNSTFPR
jgi:hypothetical protein